MVVFICWSHGHTGVKPVAILIKNNNSDNLIDPKIWKFLHSVEIKPIGSDAVDNVFMRFLMTLFTELKLCLTKTKREYAPECFSITHDVNSDELF